MSSQLSLFHLSGQFKLGDNVFGKDVANIGLYRALIAHGGFDRLHVIANRPVQTTDMPHPQKPLRVGTTTSDDLAPVAETRMLLRGQPDLGELAWQRRRLGGDHLWSMAGLIHSLGPPAMRQQILQGALAPVQPWDAFICTSPAVADAVDRLFDGWEAHLAARVGAARFTRPMLPVIPLGVDAAGLGAAVDRLRPSSRLRQSLGLDEDAVIVAWVGRLSFYEKAFPQPMMRAVAEAKAASGRPLAFVLAGWFPDGAQDRKLYEEVARAYAPDLPVIFVDGNDPAQVAEVWAGADIFLSLVDNIQETFGLTPLEAMAAGLPVVVSDWDGYRANVKDGVQGFLIPTLGGAAGELGERIAAEHALGVQTYQTYVGKVAQHTAVNVGVAANAIAALAASPELRRRMGDAGREHAARQFDWPVIVSAYKALFEDLSARRPSTSDVSTPRLNPAQDDPFATFSGFATTSLSPDLRFVLRDEHWAAALTRSASVTLDKVFSSARLDGAATQALMRRMADAEMPLTVDDLLGDLPPAQRSAAEATLAWLAKLGVIDWRA